MKNNNFFILFTFIFIVSIFLNVYFILNNQNKNIGNENFIVTEKNKNLKMPENLSKEYWENNIKNINIFNESYKAFKNINSYEEYNNWYKNFWNDLFLGFIISIWDLESYKKYWEYQYEYLIQSNKEFEGDMKNQNITSWKQFSELMSKKFSEFKDSKINNLSDLNYDDGDLVITYNKLNIEDSLTACKNLKEKFPEEYSNDEKSCENKAYAFKATKENGYCEKISDLYKVKLCNDFLNYQSK